MPRRVRGGELSPCERFWEVHVPRILAHGRDTTIPSLDCVVRFSITGSGGGEWTLSIRNGFVIDVTRAGAPGAGTLVPGITIRLDAGTFVEIASGRRDHRQAFFDGAVEIEGDEPLALWVANLLPVLRARFPFDPQGPEERRAPAPDLAGRAPR